MRISFTTNLISSFLFMMALVIQGFAQDVGEESDSSELKQEEVMEDEDGREQEDEYGEEEDEEDNVSPEQVIAFAKKRLPDFFEYITELREELDDEEFKEFLVDQGRELLVGYREIKETHGRRTSEKFLELFMVNLRIERMMEEMEDEEGSELSADAKKELKQLVSQRFTLQLVLEKAELNLLKAEVEDFELEINRRVENRDDIIKEEILEILEDVGIDSEENEEAESDENDGEPEDESDDEESEEDKGSDTEENEDLKKKVA